jgi:hypothetical protein
MAGRCPVVCVSLRWLHASCAVASAALRPAGRPHMPVTAESWTPRMSRIADVPERGWCVFAARQLSTGFGGEHWRAAPRGGNGIGGGVACLLVPAAGRQPGQMVELRRGPAGIVPCGLSGVLSRGLCGVRPSRARYLLSGLCWSALWADSVRGCPCASAAGSPRARTYSGQRRCVNPHPPYDYPELLLYTPRVIPSLPPSGLCCTAGVPSPSSRPALKPVRRVRRALTWAARRRAQRRRARRAGSPG